MLGVARRRQLLARALKLARTISAPPAPSLAQTTRCQSLRQTLAPSISRAFSSLPSIRQQAAYATNDEIEPNGLPQELTKFTELAEHGLISPKVIDTIVNRMNIHTMTDVQRLTINECLDGADVIAQAKTGTGKTLAFLMPIVQRILRDPNLERRSYGYDRRASAGDIRAVIISPTRELAEQIAVEAKKIVHNTAVRVQTAVGGTQKSMHLRMMQREGCHILVGTPGRIQDLLSDQYSGVSLENIEVFVLDEADRLLDIGFAPAIQEIQSFMPPREKRERQTLMFSATVPKEVVSLVRQTLRPDFKFIRTVDPDEAPTHARVPQHVAFLRGLENQLPAILELANKCIAAHKADPENNMPFKAIVYFASTAEVNLAYNVFENLRSPAAPGGSRMFTPHPLEPTRILEMHSKLTQNERTRNSQTFRAAKSAILFSSDVTARGMDFPNVSHVIQVGLPRSADDYIHRIGRTGRAGKAGEGWLILQEDEANGYKRYLSKGALNIKENNLLKTATLDMSRASQLPQNVAEVLNMIQGGVKATPRGVKVAAYQGMLGVLGQGSGGMRSKQAIIDMLNDLARYGWGMEKPPALSSTLVSKLGYSRCSGIEIDDSYGDRDDRKGGFGGARNGGFGGGRGGRRDDFNPRDPFGKEPIGFGSGGRSGGLGGDRGGDRGAFGGRSGGFGNRGGDRGGDRGGNRGGFGGGFGVGSRRGKPFER
jgi:ATP-dependent RNA helicase MSS116